jgi:hypothetical protein
VTRATLADRLYEALLAERGVEERKSRFSDRQALWVDGMEFVHMHGRDASIRLTRKTISAERARLRSDPRVAIEGPDWILVRLARADDLALAIELGRAAVAATRGRSSPGR